MADFNVPRTAFPNFFYVNQEESTASSIYNSLAIQPAHELPGMDSSTQANYVWSHSIDNASDLEDFIPNASQPNNSLDPQAERGNSNFDIRQRFSWNFTYQFPKFEGSYARLKNGWGIDGVATCKTGQPFYAELQLRRRLLGFGEGFDRPDVVGPIQYGSAPAQLPRPGPFQFPAPSVTPPRSRPPAIATALPARVTSAIWDATRWSGRLQGVQLLGLQRHGAHRAGQPATSRRILQPLQSSQLRQSGAAELHRRSGVNGIAGNGRGMGSTRLRRPVTLASATRSSAEAVRAAFSSPPSSPSRKTQIKSGF